MTKSKAVFPTDDSLFKMLYLAMLDITKKWTGRRQDWPVIHARLAVYYADRMPDLGKIAGNHPPVKGKRLRSALDTFDSLTVSCYFVAKGRRTGLCL